MLRPADFSLGFDLKWDLGWMNDSLVYLEALRGSENSWKSMNIAGNGPFSSVFWPLLAGAGLE